MFFLIIGGAKSGYGTGSSQYHLFLWFFLSGVKGFLFPNGTGLCGFNTKGKEQIEFTADTISPLVGKPESRPGCLEKISTRNDLTKIPKSGFTGSENHQHRPPGPNSPLLNGVAHTPLANSKVLFAGVSQSGDTALSKSVVVRIF
jgi:hypothetical protein